MTTLMIKRASIVLSGIASLTAAGTAIAHPGHEPDGALIPEGLIHPLTAFDPLLSMLAVILLGALLHPPLRRVALIPVAFLAMLAAL